jgi:hypothetical protein
VVSVPAGVALNNATKDATVLLRTVSKEVYKQKATNKFRVSAVIGTTAAGVTPGLLGGALIKALAKAGFEVDVLNVRKAVKNDTVRRVVNRSGRV